MKKQSSITTTMPSVTPLHGTKTHPLTPAAYEMLERLSRGAVVGPEINPGLANRFLREALAEWVNLPSPYKTKPGMYHHMQITEAGRRALEQRERQSRALLGEDAK